MNANYPDNYDPPSIAEPLPPKGYPSIAEVIKPKGKRKLSPVLNAGGDLTRLSNDITGIKPRPKESIFEPRPPNRFSSIN